MDFEQNNGTEQNKPIEPPQPPGSPAAVYRQMQRPEKKNGWKIFWGIWLGLSVVGNIVFFLIVVGLLAVVVTGKTDFVTEKVLISGNKSTKIAVVNINGIIDSATAADVVEQLHHAEKDTHVKAIIISVDSPGGTISGSDRIYNEILNCRNMSGKPVTAFMHNLAASGGYYVSAASEKIVAEPTVITGSIGVIMGYMVFEQLLEDKLGISPVIVKSGEKKDWPSVFHKPDETQLAYINNKIIQPAYNRFTQIVADGRNDLSLADVKKLADGSIYSANEALENKLIDKIGYFADAVKTAEELAGISNAYVVEYKKPFTLGTLFGAQAKSIFKINRKTVYQMATPDVMYLWSIY